MEAGTGLFFGSFNPVHNGHLKIAQYLLEQGYCSEVWFVVSPRNPMKQEDTLLDECKRWEILNAALGKDPRMQACDIEFDMPRPSYTVDTLQALRERWPAKKFALIMGEDNLQNFHLWKKAEVIAANYRMLVYPRKGISTTRENWKNLIFVNAPLADVSSTQIRRMIKEGEDISAWVPSEALSLILKYYGGHK